MIYRPIGGPQRPVTPGTYQPPGGQPVFGSPDGNNNGFAGNRPVPGFQQQGGYRQPSGGNPWDDMGDVTRKNFERWKKNQRKDPWTGQPIGDVSEKAYWQFLNPGGPGAVGPRGGGYQSPGGAPIKQGGAVGGVPGGGQKVLPAPGPPRAVPGLPPQYRPYERPRFQATIDV